MPSQDLLRRARLQAPPQYSSQSLESSNALPISHRPFERRELDARVVRVVLDNLGSERREVQARSAPTVQVRRATSSASEGSRRRTRCRSMQGAVRARARCRRGRRQSSRRPTSKDWVSAPGTRFFQAKGTTGSGRRYAARRSGCHDPRQSRSARSCHRRSACSY